MNNYFINRKNIPQEVPLTDTELIELAGLVESLQDKIINAYYNYIDPDTLDSLDNAEQATKDYNSKQMELFNDHKIYINNNGSLLIPQKEEYKQQ